MDYEDIINSFGKEREEQYFIKEFEGIIALVSIDDLIGNSDKAINCINVRADSFVEKTTTAGEGGRILIG